MKLLAFLALIGATSAQEIAPMDFEVEDASEDLLDIRMSRWGGERLRNKMRAKQNAWDAITRPDPSERRAMKAQMERDQRDVFGWTFEEKYNQMRPIDRYGPLARKFVRSQQVKAWVDYRMTAWREDPMVQSLKAQVKALVESLTYHRGRYGYERPSIQPDQLRERPTPEESKEWSRYQRDRADIEGIHIENDDLKDIAEDIQDILETDYAASDPDSELVKGGYRVFDAAFHEPNFVKMLKMLQDDLGIHNEQEFEAAAGRFGEKLADKLENCPYFQRLKKANERLFRAACRNVDVSDLPTGRRMSWVNDLTKALYDIMKSEDPVQQWGHAVEHTLEEFFRAYMKEVARHVAARKKMGMDW